MAEAPVRLTRSTDRIIAGVCGGIAEYLGWSRAGVRIAYVLISIFSAAFPGILAYIILWALMPPTRTPGQFDLSKYRVQ